MCMFSRSLFVLLYFFFGRCAVCSSSIYGFWLPLWYLQTLNQESTGKCLRQVEHIRCHLWHRYSISINHVMVTTVRIFEVTSSTTLLLLVDHIYLHELLYILLSCKYLSYISIVYMIYKMYMIFCHWKHNFTIHELDYLLFVV
jgi:hypothetical protein